MKNITKPNGNQELQKKNNPAQKQFSAGSQKTDNGFQEFIDKLNHAKLELTQSKEAYRKRLMCIKAEKAEGLEFAIGMLESNVNEKELDAMCKIVDSIEEHADYLKKFHKPTVLVGYDEIVKQLGIKSEEELAQFRCFDAFFLETERGLMPATLWDKNGLNINKQDWDRMRIKHQ